MIVTRDQEFAQRMRVMRLHGIDRDAFDRFRSNKPSWYYEIVAPGYKYNLTDMASAIGRVQLRRLPGFLDRRRELAARYMVDLAQLPLVLPADARAGDVHAWHLYAVRLSDAALDRGFSRDRVLEELVEQGIGISVHYVPLHRQPYWRDRYALSPKQFPVSEDAYQRIFTLPLYTRMTDRDQTRVIDALTTVLA